MRFRATFPPTVETVSDPPSSTASISVWTNRFVSVQSLVNSSLSNTRRTRPWTYPWIAFVNGATRTAPRSGKRSVTKASTSIRDMIRWVTLSASACWTPGSSARGPTSSTNRSVLSAVRRAQAAGTVAVKTKMASATMIGVRTRRSRRFGLFGASSVFI